jgi:glycosyltransferase involved in cell wall biosynthesis
MIMSEKYNEDIVVSVCVTAYNHGKYIAQALDSILMQEVDFKYEIVVGEDCSTDNTREILLSYKERFPDKLKLLLHEKNLGAKKNVIATLDNCSGKYIAMLDGDDYWIDPEKLRIQIALMEEHPECHMSFHPAESRIENARTGRVVARRAKENKIFTASEVILGGGGFSPTASTIFHREVIENLPEFFEETPVGDYYMQILGAVHGGALYIDRVMSVYRQGIEGSWSHEMKNIDIDKKIKLHHAYMKALHDLDMHLNGEFHKEIEQRRSRYYYKIAVFYLKNDRYEAFKKNIELSFNTYVYKSLPYLFMYYFRFFPKLLLSLQKVKMKFGR